MGDADDYYALETKRAEEEFIEKLQNGKTFEEVEKEYLSETEKIRKTYKKRLDKELREIPKKKKEKKKKEKKEIFTVKKFTFEPTFKERLLYSINTKSFKLKREIILFFRKPFFDYFRLMYFKTKYLFRNIRRMYDDTKEAVINWLGEVWKWTKETFKKIWDYIILIKNKVKDKLKREKKDEKGDKKSNTKESNETSDTNKSDASDTKESSNKSTEDNSSGSTT